MIHFLFGLLFFPSVTFGLYDSEVFPYGFIFFFISAFWVKFHISDFSYVAYLLFSALLFTTLSNGTYILNTLWSLGAFLNSYLAFLSVYHLPESLIRRYRITALWIFGFILLFGIAQKFNFLASYDFFNFLIPKFSGSDLGLRGVTLLSNEPSRAGIFVSFCYLLFRTHILSNVSLLQRLFIDVLIIAYMVFFIESLQAVALIFGILSMIYFSKVGFRNSLFLLCILVSSSAIILMLTGPDGRVGLLINELSNLDSDEWLLYISNQSGHRMFSWYASYLYAFLNPLGALVGNWHLGSFEAAIASGFDLNQLSYYRLLSDQDVSFRGSGYLTNLALEGGIIGLVLFALSMSHFFRDANAKLFGLIFLFYLFFFGSPGDPVPFVVIALILRKFTSYRSD